MVEYRPQPGGGHISRVAAYASCRIGRRHMIRNRSAISLRVCEVGLMAAIAIRCRVTGSVVAAQVAVGTRIDHRPNRARNRCTRRQHMRTLQREPRRAVVELSIRPEHRVVTGRAERGRKACRDVVRHIPTKCWRAGPGRLVAAIAIRIRRCERVVVAHVAIRAGYHFARRRQLVRTRQSPAGHGVIKHYVRPQCRVVAGPAIGRRKRRPRR